MWTWPDRLRNWLTKNKVFFETIAAATLTGMAIVVSCNANHIAKAQTALTERQMLPFIQVAPAVYKDSLGRYSELAFDVRNDGGPLREVGATCVVFFRLTASRESETDTVYVPVIGFYAGHGVTSASTGVVASFHGFENNLRLAKLQQDVFAFSRGPERWTDFEVLQVLGVFYTDQFGSRHEDYFHVTQFGSSTMPNEKANQWFSRFDNSLSSHSYFRFDSEGADALVEKARRVMRERP